MTDIDKANLLILVLSLAVLVLITVTYMADRARRAALDALAAAQTAFAARLTQERQEWYAAGFAQAERESKQSFERGRRQGAQEAAEVFTATGMSEWN